MEKMNLSLKSIYRLLMTNDFPIYSESVIDEKNRKGQTLLKFWQSLVVSEFRSLPCGQIIWRNDGRRNRYISNLCNRNPEMKFYPEYAKEIASQISTDTLLNQLQKFSAFLSGRNYKHDILLRRIRELMRLAQTDDPHVSHAIAAQIEDAIGWQDGDSNKSLFQASYLLTVLMLYAAAGEAMDDSVMDVLRAEDYSICELWNLKLNPPAAAQASVTYLTEHIGMLQDKPLPHQRFFGREEELFNLKEMAVQGRKCLISGVGGIGKTEMLRQLIQSYEEEQSIDYIAIVPYTTAIVESFGKVFPDFRFQEAEESFNHVLYQIEQKAAEGSKVLLLIDNMNSSLEDDPALSRLASLSCAVLISSRRPELEGFETYHICDPAVSTCSLIFRDNYGKPLTHEDRSVLNELLHNGSLRHPLTLRLLARAAHSNSWRVQELKDQLMQSQISLTWVEDDHPVKLDQIYHQLYSYGQIPDSCEKLVELFTLLPRDSYSPMFLANVFAPVTVGDDLTYRLNLLAVGGWLDETDNGYAMHPLIAQCLRRKVLNEKKLRPVLNCLAAKFPKTALLDTSVYYDETLRRLSEIFVYISEFLTGSISRDLMLDTLNAMDLLVPTQQATACYEKLLNQFYRRCSAQDDLVDVRYCITLGHWMHGNKELIEATYRKQKENLSIPRSRYLDLCLYAGGAMMFAQQFALSEEMLKEVLCPDAHPVQKATAYYHLSVHSQFTGNAEAALNWSQQGVEYVTRHPECGKELVFNNLAALCSFYLKFGQKDLAKLLLDKLKAEVGENALPMHKVQYADLAGAYELNFGCLEQALAHYQEDLKLRLEYYSKDQNYYVLLGQIAIVYQRMKRYEEALENYHAIIAHAKRAGDAALLHMFSNNLAVLYLDLQKPEEAIPHLNTALEFARKQGGIALGEGLKNMARAHGLLGEYTKERECLTEAVPLLEAAYGPQHPRAAAARTRLEELTSGEG